MATKLTRLALPLSDDWIAAINSHAESLGIPATELIRRGILKILPADVRKSLSQAPTRGRPRKVQSSQ